MRDGGQSIPMIYATLENRNAYHQASIIDMDGKICDQFVSILNGPGCNYSYVCPNCQESVISKIGKFQSQKQHYFNHFGIVGSSPPESGEGSLQ